MLRMWWNALAAMIGAVLTAYALLAIGLVAVLVIGGLVWLTAARKRSQ